MYEERFLNCSRKEGAEGKKKGQEDGKRVSACVYAQLTFPRHLIALREKHTLYIFYPD